MEKVMKYQNLNHALKLFRGQVSESIPYALDNLPKFSTPSQAFDYLKSRTVYKKDPKGRELFQTMPTLFDNNWHSITGAGDCDCFTIAALATLLASGYDCGIVLVGRNPLVPVHIYAYVLDNGTRQYFDLTNRDYGYERFYPYRQHIPFKLNQEEQNMILELAEMGAGKRLKKFAGNAGNRLMKNKLIRHNVQRAERLRHIYLPNLGIQVREDYYDNMTPGEFQHKMLSEGVDPHEIVELSGKRAQRRKADRQERRANKPRNVRKRIKQESKAQARIMNAQAAINRSLNPNAAPDDDDDSGSGVKGFFNRVVNALPTGPDDNSDDSQPDDGGQPDDDGLSEMTVKKGLLIGLGVAAIATGTVLFIKHNKNKRRSAA